MKIIITDTSGQAHTFDLSDPALTLKKVPQIEEMRVICSDEASQKKLLNLFNVLHSGQFIPRLRLEALGPQELRELRLFCRTNDFGAVTLHNISARAFQEVAVGQQRFGCRSCYKLVFSSVAFIDFVNLIPFIDIRADRMDLKAYETQAQLVILIKQFPTWFLRKSGIDFSSKHLQMLQERPHIKGLILEAKQSIQAQEHELKRAKAAMMRQRFWVQPSKAQQKRFVRQAYKEQLLYHLRQASSAIRDIVSKAPFFIAIDKPLKSDTEQSYLKRLRDGVVKSCLDFLNISKTTAKRASISKAFDHLFLKRADADFAAFQIEVRYGDESAERYEFSVRKLEVPLHGEYFFVKEVTKFELVSGQASAASASAAPAHGMSRSERE